VEVNILPEATNNIVFFDGVCGLCNRSVDFLIERDVHKKLRYSSLQGELAQTFFKADSIKRPAENLDSIVFYRDGYTYTHSSAVMEILKALGGSYKALGQILGWIPQGVRDGCYQVIARHRYKIFGHRDQCRRPSTEEQGLFIP